MLVIHYRDSYSHSVQTQMVSSEPPTPWSPSLVQYTIYFATQQKKNSDEVETGACQHHALVLLMFCCFFLFCFLCTRDIPVAVLFGLNCKQLPTHISREQSLSPMGSATCLFLWNHANRVAFKRCHFTFFLLSGGTLSYTHHQGRGKISVLTPAVCNQNCTLKWI